MRYIVLNTFEGTYDLVDGLCELDDHCWLDCIIAGNCHVFQVGKRIMPKQIRKLDWIEENGRDYREE